MIYGEVFTKTWWNTEKGQFLGQEVILGENQEEVQRVNSFEGDVCVDLIYPFDVVRDSGGATFEQCRWIGLKKLIDSKELKNKFPVDDKRRGYVSEENDSHYAGFSGSSGDYRNIKNQTLVMEIYFRSCSEYPEGHYFIFTDKGMLFEGSLGGIFPIDYLGYDPISTSPRSSSVIRQIKPDQYNVNRMMSKMVEHQVKFGDDVLLTQAGTKLANGHRVTGVRSITYTGQKPDVLTGRTGIQYLEPLKHSISEMYTKSGVPELSDEKVTQVDPNTAIYRSAKQKQKFSLYSEKYESFLVDVFFKVLKLKKMYMSESSYIRVAGKTEVVNIPEFKSMDDLSYEIRLDLQSEDMDSKFARQMNLNQVLQYSGSSMGKEELGQLLRDMPYANATGITSELTMEVENAENDILALDRGEWVEPKENDSHDYLLRKLTNRTKKSDFKILPIQVQQMYQQKISIHSEIKARQAQELQRAQAGLIPTSGSLVPVQVYEMQPNSQGGFSPKRVMLPEDAIKWLKEQMDAQGSFMSEMQMQSNETQAGIAEQLNNFQPPLTQTAVNEYGPQGQDFFNQAPQVQQGGF